MEKTTKEKLQLSINPIGLYLLLQTYLMVSILAILLLGDFEIITNEGEKIIKIIRASTIFTMYPIMIWITQIIKHIKEKWKKKNTTKN